MSTEDNGRREATGEEIGALFAQLAQQMDAAPPDRPPREAPSEEPPPAVFGTRGWEALPEQPGAATWQSVPPPNQGPSRSSTPSGAGVPPRNWDEDDPLPRMDDAPLLAPVDNTIEIGSEINWTVNWEPDEARGPVIDPWGLQLTPEMYPNQGMFPAWLEACRQTTDSPPIHHWSTLVSILGAALGRRHRIEHVPPLAPNVYVLNISLSGAGRKSTTISLGLSVFPPERILSTVPRSDAALLEELCDEKAALYPAWRLFTLDEASALLAQLESVYQPQLLTHLIQAYDGNVQISTRTKSGGTRRAELACLSILAATTDATLLPSDVQAARRHELLCGGLFGRFLLLPASRDTTYLEARPFNEARAQWFRERIQVLHDARRARYATLPYWLYRISDGAKLELYRWLAKIGQFPLESRPELPPPTKSLASFWERITTHIKKLCLIYHVSQGGTSSEPISPETMIQVLTAMHRLLIPAQRAVTDLLYDTPFKAQLARVREIFEREQFLNWNEAPELLGCSRGTCAELLAAIDKEIHWETWANLQRVTLPNGQEGTVVARGRPSFIAVFGSTLLAPSALQGRRRIRPDAEPPRSVKRLLDVPEEPTDGSVEELPSDW